MKGEVYVALQQYKVFILVVTAALALLIASPSIQQLLVYPQTDSLTEFYLFGSNHNAAYPSNVTADQNNRMYLEVANHLGSCAYYQVEIKFRNQTQSGPNSFNHTHSDLPSLATLTVLVAENATEEIPLDISFQYNLRNATRMRMENITVNGYSLDASSTTIAYDTNKYGFYGNLIFELWIYNSTTNSFQYHERYLSLWLEMTT
ncbi:MAG TPA: DUF1616 domain-containing protein [Candidatus Acidoferrales bacterium]|nr:DUF1616 domain-containing protein [Candidatus Acidoferrales bacterium]